MTIGYSVIIPAYNEEHWLPATLSALKIAMNHQSLTGEIIVVDNNSEDNTKMVAEQAGARVVFEPVNQISRARNAGARQASGQYLIFVDADSHVSADLLHDALNQLSGGTCCGGGAVVQFDRPIGWFGNVILTLWNWFSLTFNLAAGSFMYCTRDGFLAIGGLSEAVYAADEIGFSRQLRAWGCKKGMKFWIIKDYPIVTSGRKVEWYSTSYQILLILMLMLFPFAVRFRSLCSFWYKRPNK